MPRLDARIDDYIASAQPFARPILRHLRQLVHTACPDVAETIKWGFAAFDFRGPLCSMAAFKQHAVFGFWKAQLLQDPHGYLQLRSSQGGQAMGQLGRLASLQDLPPDAVMLDFIEQARKLNEQGMKLPPRAKSAVGQELAIPDFLVAALQQNEKAAATFAAFPYSHKKEYVEWLAEAKTEATRQKRLATALEWLTEGRQRNWKYQKKLLAGD